jgi:hypothetical protein
MDQPRGHAAGAPEGAEDDEKAQGILAEPLDAALRDAFAEPQHIHETGTEVHRRLHGGGDADRAPLRVLLNPLGQGRLALAFLGVPPVRKLG